MKVLVGIPVYNERQYVTNVLKEVRRYTTTIAMVDDGSTDGSGEILVELHRAGRIKHLVQHRENGGYGQALITLFNLARDEAYDCLITLDCDEQHQPCQIPAFIEALDGCDIVSGTRYPKVEQDGQDPPPPDRLQINREITRRINRLTGYDLTDSFCGFKNYNRRAIEALQLHERGYGMPLELWVKAAQADLRVREIPVHRIYKDHTRSFGGSLDNSEERLAYYESVIKQALSEVGQ